MISIQSTPLEEGQTELLEAVLKMAIRKKAHPDILVALLAATFPVRSSLGSRNQLFDTAKTALEGSEETRGQSAQILLGLQD